MKGFQKYSEKQMAKIVDYYNANNLSLKSVGEKYGVPEHAVAYWAKKLGVNKGAPKLKSPSPLIVKKRQYTKKPKLIEIEAVDISHDLKLKFAYELMRFLNEK